METIRSLLCPGCGLRLPKIGIGPPDRCNASPECLQICSDLMCSTVAKQDPEFIHQHAVDTYAARHAGGTTRNITVAFGLIGLCPALERGYTGKEVQRAHMGSRSSGRNGPGGNLRRSRHP